MVLVDHQLLDSAATGLSSVSAHLVALRSSSISSLFQVYRPDAASVVDSHLTSATAVLSGVRSDLLWRARLAEELETRDLSRPAGHAGQADDHGDAAGAFADHILNPHGLTRSEWAQIALREAGIDPGRWRPELGLRANEDIVVAVYNFYGDLYLSDSRLQWAGMANLVGPMFYGGWLDLTALRHVTDPMSRVRRAVQLVSTRGAGSPAALAPGLAALATAELAWLEVALLAMQKQIFEDLAWMHVAFRHGGLDAVARNLDDRHLLRAWEEIASGDPVRVRAGNAALLRREQLTVIQDDYARIAAHHGWVGAVFADALTWMADAPFPGSRAYRDVVTTDVTISVPRVQHLGWWPPRDWVSVDAVDWRVSVSRGRVTEFDDRWEWIESDLLPAYHRLLDEPGAVDTLIATPVGERAAAFRRIPPGVG